MYVTCRTKVVVLYMEVDTGACISEISKGDYLSKFSNIKLLEFKRKLFTVSGQTLGVISKAQLRVSLGATVHLLEIVVMDGERLFNALLGRNWLDVLYPNWRSNFCNIQSEVNSISKSENIVSELEVN